MIIKIPLSWRIPIVAGCLISTFALSFVDIDEIKMFGIFLVGLALGIGLFSVEEEK